MHAVRGPPLRPNLRTFPEPHEHLPPQDSSGFFDSDRFTIPSVLQSMQFVRADRFLSLGAGATYNIRVGRSRQVTGPYLDAAGKDMELGGGTLVIGAKDAHGNSASGHAGVLELLPNLYLLDSSKYSFIPTASFNSSNVGRSSSSGYPSNIIPCNAVSIAFTLTANIDNG